MATDLPRLVHEASELERAVARLKEAYEIPVEDHKNHDSKRYVALTRETLARSVFAGSTVLYSWVAHIVPYAGEKSILENPKFVFQGLKRPGLIDYKDWYAMDRVLAYYAKPEHDWAWRNGVITKVNCPKDSLFVVYLHFFPPESSLTSLRRAAKSDRISGKIRGWEWVKINPTTGWPENANGRFLKRLKPPPG